MKKYIIVAVFAALLLNVILRGLLSGDSQEVYTFKEGVNEMQTLPDKLVVVSRSGKVGLLKWDRLDSQIDLGIPPVSKLAVGDSSYLAVDKGGKLVGGKFSGSEQFLVAGVTASENIACIDYDNIKKQYVVVEVHDGEIKLSSIDDDNNKTVRSRLRLEGIRILGADADSGKVALAGSLDGRAWVGVVLLGENRFLSVYEDKGHEYCRHILFDSKKELVVFAGDSYSIKCMDMDLNKVVHEYMITEKPLPPAKKFNVSSLALSADNAYLAAAEEPFSNVMVWDFKSGELVKEFPGGTIVNALSFSPDSQRLAVSGLIYDSLIRLWDVNK